MLFTYLCTDQYDRGTADEILAVIDDLPVDVLDVSRTDARAAARFKARGGLPYADCFAAGLAHRVDEPVVTGDPEFEQVESKIDVRWLG